MTRAAGRKAEEFVTREELAEIIYHAQTQTEEVARLASGIVNNVLATEIHTIGSQGRTILEYGVAAGSIVVKHHGPSTTPMIVQSGTPASDTRPSNGRAMGRVDAGASSTLALTGHAFTVWGTAGDQFTVQVFTSCVPPDNSSGAGGPVSAGVTRTTTITRFASAGPAGVTAPGTYPIVAGRKSYTVTVNAAASIATPTLDGVALVAGTVRTFSADSDGDTLEAAVLITVAGDDVELLELA